MTETNFELTFLGLVLCRDGENIVTIVHRKLVNAYVYLKSTIMQIEKAVINDRLYVSKVS